MARRQAEVRAAGGEPQFKASPASDYEIPEELARQLLGVLLTSCLKILFHLPHGMEIAFDRLLMTVQPFWATRVWCPITDGQ